MFKLGDGLNNQIDRFDRVQPTNENQGGQVCGKFKWGQIDWLGVGKFLGIDAVGDYFQVAVGDVGVEFEVVADGGRDANGQAAEAAGEVFGGEVPELMLFGGVDGGDDVPDV